MGKLKTATLVILGLVLLVVLIFLLVTYLKPKVAGIYIESNPVATVFIDGLEVGRTPFEKTYKQSEVIIKLVPDSFEIPLAPYETKVSLVTGVQTVIKRDFGETDEFSAGEIISFEKIDKSQVSLAVVSIPDSAELLIDGSERAFTPHRTTSLLPGVHSLVLKAEGYQERRVDVRTYEGYKLTAIVKLAKSSVKKENPEEDLEEKVENETDEERYGKVKILSTPTGFLRVRSEPSTLGQEVGQVEPENTYDLLATDEKTGWFKIRFSKDTAEVKEGWITDQYAQITEPIPGTPTPTAKQDI